MHRTWFAEVHGSIAHTLEVAGEWWTRLVLGDVALAIVCFDDQQAPKAWHQRRARTPTERRAAASGPG